MTPEGPAPGFEALAAAAEHAGRLLADAGLRGEARAESWVELVLGMHDGTLRQASRVRSAGLGVRVLRGGRQGYAATTDPSPAAIRDAVARAARMAGARVRRGAHRGPARAFAHATGDPSDEDELAAKLALLARADRAGRDTGKEVAATVMAWRERTGRKLVVRSDGARCAWAPRFATLDAVVVSRGASGLSRGRDFHGGSLGLEAFVGERSPEALAARAARWAAERADARRPPATRCPAVVDPLLAGVVAHESFGHLVEADGVVSGWSMLARRKGERLGSTQATIRDAGHAPAGAGGIALPFDDEATPSREATLLDRGKLAGWLHDRRTAEVLERDADASTGSARALDHRFPPIPRMRNTWFAAGDLRLEEALEEARDGIYACGTTGGEARSDGSFMFTATRAYRVRRGEVGEPLRDVAILGHVQRFLRDVRGACRDLEVIGGAHVHCGKFGQWPLPVAYGGPHLLLREALFGGEGTTWGAAP